MAAAQVSRKYPKDGPQVSQWSSNADMRGWMAHLILNLREGRDHAAPRGNDPRRVIMGREDVAFAKSVVAKHERAMARKAR